jgi:hypothetical protein
MWHLEKLTGRGGLLGSTASNTFEGHRFPTEEDLLVRETVQNSRDYPAGQLKPKIVFRLVTLTGRSKATFLRTLNLRDLYGNPEILKRAADFSELRSLGGDKPLGLLFIEDFNTTGLDGRLDDPTCNWMRFNLHGDAAKLEEDGKIGSYGYGKSVLSRAAGTNTFIVYTAVKPTKGDPSTARLMGHTFQPWFDDGGRGKKTGRGWFCESTNADSDPIPFVDERAHELAEAVGFTSRSDGRTGTSFLLIGTSPARTALKIDNVRRAIETWWWPSLIDNSIDIELWEGDQKVRGPSPRTREDLKPYLACKAKLDTDVGADVQDTTFHREHDKQIGRLALTLTADESIFESPLHPKYPGPRRIARTRSEAGMVTEYREFGTAKRVSFVGYFCGARDIDKALKFSEPPTHDEWSPVSQRLARVKHGAHFVNIVEERTYHAALAFQRRNSQLRAPVTERLPALERMLGAAFVERDLGPTPKPADRPTSVGRKTMIDYPGMANGRPAPTFGAASNKLDFLIRYQLREDVDERVKVRAWLDISVAEDAQRSRGAPLQVEVIDQATGTRVAKGERPSFNVDLSPGKARVFHIRSAPYPKFQVVMFEEGEADSEARK